MNHNLVAPILALFSCLSLLVLWKANSDITESLSAQGCRMSWMSPSYILQQNFNTSWTPLASRYTLWLYREVGWQDHNLNGLPVLFITGNAGSSQQVRSIASSAARLYWKSPGVISSLADSLRPLDFFAVEFNEDLSALHGPTLSTQAAYSSRAIAYILSRYLPGTNIIVMGHSMGGIVATSLLPSDQISAIITMSTPHTLPPARFDARIDRIYDRNQGLLRDNPTPILSLCGGATDGMIPSESCILPESNGGYRRTVFSSALEGAWTGVGHREMVWCHQVRWRIARAALELGGVSPKERPLALDRWLRDGYALPPSASVDGKRPLQYEGIYTPLEASKPLVLDPPTQDETFLLPVTTSSKFILYVSGGSVSSVGPHTPIPLEVSVHTCKTMSECLPLKPTVLKLIPNPIPGKPFPVPSEGSDESEGVVVYEADVELNVMIGVRVRHTDGRGWVYGGFEDAGLVESEATALSAFVGHVSVKIPEKASLQTRISLPGLLSSSIIVYRLRPVARASDCPNSLLRPLLAHTSHPTETHYFPLSISSRPILLHSHSSAPYVVSDWRRGFNLTIYSSGCNSDISGMDISVDWWATWGRWATRYPTTLASWALGVVAIVLFRAWGDSERVPTVSQSLTSFGRTVLPKLLVGSSAFAFVPLPDGLYLGTVGEVLYSPIAPLLVMIASGLVCLVWGMLSMLMWPIKRFAGRRQEHPSVSRSTLVSMAVLLGLVFVFVPWQVAFLGCWFLHLLTCATSTSPAPPSSSTAIPLLRRESDEGHEGHEEVDDMVNQGHAQDRLREENNRNHNQHLLLLLTWLLPIVAPVLAVWVRTLLTAGFTTPFDGDHNFLNVAPFLVFADFASWNRGPLFERHRLERISVRWVWTAVAAVAFVWGPRAVYKVFDAGNVALAVVLCVRVGPRYWGR